MVSPLLYIYQIDFEPSNVYDAVISDTQSNLLIY
jgi:hypothetical protein